MLTPASVSGPLARPVLLCAWLRRAHRSALLLSIALGACAEPMTGPDPQPPGVQDPSQSPSNALVAARPYESRVPANYDKNRPAPLVVLLHGFGAGGLTQELYFGLGDLLSQTGFLYAFPDGTRNKDGKQFWNATELCCDFEKTGVDDVAYISAVIDDMKAHYSVDPARVYLIGHSNGGFMSHRFACDRAGQVAAFVSLAGANWKDPARCQPTQPVAVLQVHGDQDAQVPYAGSGMLPSAAETTAGWASKNGCQPAPSQLPGAFDLESNIDGNETDVTRYSGCNAGGAAELWTLRGGSHTPNFWRTRWPALVVEWFRAHPKPTP